MPRFVRSAPAAVGAGRVSRIVATSVVLADSKKSEPGVGDRDRSEVGRGLVVRAVRARRDRALPAEVRRQALEGHEERPEREVLGAGLQDAERAHVLDHVVGVEVVEGEEGDVLRRRAADVRAVQRVAVLELRDHAVGVGVVRDVDRGAEERGPLDAGDDVDLGGVRRGRRLGLELRRPGISRRVSRDDPRGAARVQPALRGERRGRQAEDDQCRDPEAQSLHRFSSPVSDVPDPGGTVANPGPVCRPPSSYGTPIPGVPFLGLFDLAGCTPRPDPAGCPSPAAGSQVEKRAITGAPSRRIRNPRRTACRRGLSPSCRRASRGR